MSQGDEFKFQRGAAAHPEREQGTEGGQKREHAKTVYCGDRNATLAGLLEF
jgi:hypothetical protein